jgi:hypothetical protein
MFGKVKKFISWNRLGLKLGRVQDVLEKEKRMQGYDPKVTLLKGLKAFAVSALAVAVTAILAWAGDNAVIAKTLQEGGLSPALVAVLVPLIHGGVQMLTNWWKNRGKVTVPAVGGQG